MAECINCETETSNTHINGDPLCVNCRDSALINEFFGGKKDVPFGCPDCGEVLAFGSSYVQLTADLIHVDIEYLLCPRCNWAAIKAA